MNDESVGQTYEQKGFITFGGGINETQWMLDAKAQGYVVRPVGTTHAELYRLTKSN